MMSKLNMESFYKFFNILIPLLKSMFYFLCMYSCFRRQKCNAACGCFSVDITWKHCASMCFTVFYLFLQSCNFLYLGFDRQSPYISYITVADHNQGKNCVFFQNIQGENKLIVQKHLFWMD